MVLRGRGRCELSSAGRERRMDRPSNAARVQSFGSLPPTSYLTQSRLRNVYPCPHVLLLMVGVVGTKTSRSTA